MKRARVKSRDGKRRKELPSAYLYCKKKKERKKKEV
jgi:hypothetical protein